MKVLALFAAAGVASAQTCPDVQAIKDSVPQLEQAFETCTNFEELIKVAVACTSGNAVGCLSGVVHFVLSGKAQETFECISHPKASVCSIVEGTDLYKESITCEKTLGEYLTAPVCSGFLGVIFKPECDFMQNIPFLKENTVQGLAQRVCQQSTDLKGLVELNAMLTPKPHVRAGAPVCGLTPQVFVKAAEEIGIAAKSDTDCLELQKIAAIATTCMARDYLNCAKLLFEFVKDGDIQKVEQCIKDFKPDMCQSMESTELYKDSASCSSTVGQFLEQFVCFLPNPICARVKNDPKLQVEISALASKFDNICTKPSLRI
uniref:Uncharacterized protein n=1 Tax=Mucochytrium quahogii TaxID=96639 RepID=A0A7S2W3F3_9STRA|mmetsp:Transcript_6270/g.10755  ORF Transcript_6270/g.10755 Transcript_6270/m.10755 type:complete len:318 (+) Transcript_6270:667-1620(+)